MICPPCRRGGLINTISNEPARAGRIAADDRSVAMVEHTHCAGGTRCDCQHRTGKWLSERSDG